MMNLDRAIILNLNKLISVLCFLFVVIVFVNIMLNDDLEESCLFKKKQKNQKDKKENFDFCKFEEKKLFGINRDLICENSSKFSYVFKLTDNEYIYYSFALMLGGVLNSKNIMKIGIF